VTARRERETGPKQGPGPGAGPGPGSGGGRGPGRRPGPTETRAEILAAARRLFSEKGYEAVSVRAIARAAQVDPALVHHFFDNKERLFVTALQFPIEPSTVLPGVLDGPREELGERLVRMFVGIWNDPATREAMLALLRAAISTERAATMMRQFVTSAILARITETSGIPPLRITGAIGQMIGVMIVRYVVKVEPMASVDDEELVALLTPVLQRYFDTDDAAGSAAVRS
jgi:AcrR family transcriptional regulator